MSKFDAPDTPSGPEAIWAKWGLQLNQHKTPHLNLNNAALVLECDPLYKDSLYFDVFLQRVIRQNSPAREWGDADDLEVTRHFQSVLGMPRMGRDIVSQAVIAVAHKRQRNCVREWVDKIQWDGQARIEQFFADYMGAENNEYAQCASRNFWLSIAARIHVPGCKVDNMIVLEGAQGAGKSTALHIIGGEWFTEQHESAANPKAFAEILQGKLLVEISEMDSFHKAEVTRVKQTISCSSDRFRASYSRHAADHPRTCVFVGTTNREDWSRDETGARRFWPIACTGRVNLEGIRSNRDQLFAEAKTRYLAGEDYWKMPLVATRREQEARFQSDPWLPKIEHVLKGKAEVTTNQIMEEMGIELLRRGKQEQMRVGTILRFLGWSKRRVRTDAGREYIYEVGTGRDGGDGFDQ